MYDVISELFFTFVWNWRLRVFPLYIAVFVALAYLIFRVREKGATSFLTWLFPKRIYFNASQWVDFQLFVVGRLMGMLGVFGVVAGSTAVAVFTIVAITSLTGADATGLEMSAGQGFAATLLIIIAADFSVYWIHRMHHEIDFLWPFHAVHHSAEVMSPITVYRKHPVYDIISKSLKSLLIGVAQGIILAFTFDGTSVLTIGGANAAYFLFNLAGANFRHSHIWIGYGKWLSHILISPAQHQIHHSRAPEHLDKNHGEVFAVWDWMFGTLYVPQKQEALEFGIVDAEGKVVAQPHGTLKDALVEPFLSCKEALKQRKIATKAAKQSQREHIA